MVEAVRPEIDDPDPGWLERPSRITARTLVIGGGPGSHIPQDRVAEMARRITGALLVTIPAGHMVHEDAPDAFVREVTAFLGQRLCGVPRTLRPVLPGVLRPPRSAFAEVALPWGYALGK